MKSRIVRPQFESDSSPSPPVTAPSLPLTNVELGDRTGSLRQGGADSDSSSERYSSKYVIDGFSGGRRTDTWIPVASHVGRDSSRDRVRDRDDVSMRERDRDGRPSGDREIKGFISAANGKTSDRDRGPYRDSERYTNGGLSRNRYRHGESGSRPGDDLIHEELEKNSF